mmetsp:Transcript_96881/g.145125  ORF Transcript_96881/g.145125 Transcript_96881/m.145125 type:complete len:406 (-) Transcript_96881:125-1342(-)
MTKAQTSECTTIPLQESSRDSLLDKSSRRGATSHRLTTTRRRACLSSIVLMTLVILLQNDLVQARLQWKGRKYLKFKGPHEKSSQRNTEAAAKDEQQQEDRHPTAGPTINKTASSSPTTWTRTKTYWYSLYFDSDHDNDPYEIETTDIRQPTTADSSDITTDAMRLVKEFEQVLAASSRNNNNFNKKKSSSKSAVVADDIHVGRLLLACKQLETAIRQIGFSQSANDIVGNIQKIRKVYDKLPHDDHRRDSMKYILRHELDSGIHTNRNNNNSQSGGGNHFVEDSAAMGFLWLARNINYQCDMFDYMLSDDNVEPYEAASFAYERSLRPHLPWALQKLGRAALMALKPMKRVTILSRIGGFENGGFVGSLEERATKRDMQSVLDRWRPLLDSWRRVFSDMNLVQI